MRQPKILVAIKQVQGLGNRPEGSKFFTTRPDIKPHFHKPGRYYCGICMQHVIV